MDTEWLKAQFATQPGKTRAALAASLGLTPPAVSKMLAGARQIKALEYMVMRRFFGLPATDDGLRSSNGYIISPLNAGMAENGNASIAESWVMPASLLQGRTTAPLDAIRMFAVPDQAMAPDFTCGEQLLVDLSVKAPGAGGVFVVSDGFGAVLRHAELVPHSNPAEVRFTARHPSCAPFTRLLSDASIIGRVMAKLQWV